MKFWGFFICTVAAVLILFTQQSKGLFDVSLCLGQVNGNGCQNAERSVYNSTNENENSAVLKMAFNNFYNSVTDAAYRAIDGFSRAIKLASKSKPTAAAQAVQDAIQDARDILYDALVFLYQALGEASSVSNDTGLVDIHVKIQLIALELLDEMRSVISLLNEAIDNEPDTSMQELMNLCSLGIKAGFDAMYATIEICVVDAQRQNGPTQTLVSNQNYDAASNDSDATATISEINKDAQDAIKNGADRSKVNALRTLLERSVRDAAQVSAHVSLYFAYTQTLGQTDSSSAQSIYLAEAKGVCKSIQELFANICLNLGAAGVNSNDSSKKQMRIAIKLVLQANYEMVSGNKIAKHFTLISFLFNGSNACVSAANAAIQGGRYAKIAYNNRIMQAAEIAFNALKTQNPLCNL